MTSPNKRWQSPVTIYAGAGWVGANESPPLSHYLRPAQGKLSAEGDPGEEPPVDQEAPATVDQAGSKELTEGRAALTAAGVVLADPVSDPAAPHENGTVGGTSHEPPTRVDQWNGEIM